MSMNDHENEDTMIYKVVMNHEKQYSIWPDYKETPRKWKVVSKTGSKTECLPLSSVHQGCPDRYEAAQSEEKDGKIR
jgi:uncharacterized protein YbdZ (MbtH family)